jgi:hypothetical protein
MMYAVEVYNTEDWGDGPIYDSNYKFRSLTECLMEIRYRFQIEIDTSPTPLEWLGARIISLESDGVEEPLVEETISPRVLGFK